MRSLQGHVAIQGFLIKPGDIPHPVYSPDCSSLLAVGTVQLQVPSGDYRETIRASLGNEERVTVERILGVVDVTSVVLVFSRLDCRMCRYVAGIKPFTQLFRGSSDQSTATQVGALDLAILGRDVQELHMRYDEDYTRAVRQYCDEVTKGMYINLLSTIAPSRINPGVENMNIYQLWDYCLDAPLSFQGSE